MIEILRKVKAALPAGRLVFIMGDFVDTPPDDDPTWAMIAFYNNVATDNVVKSCWVTDDEWGNNPNLVHAMLQMLG